MARIVLFGGGAHCQCAVDIIQREGRHQIVGIVDSVKDAGSEICGIPVIGRQEQIARLVESHSVEAGLIAIGDNWKRKIVYDAVVLRLPSFVFVSAIHPSAVVGNNVRVGRGVLVMAGCIINPNAVLGDFTMMMTGAQLDHDSALGDFASLSAGSVTGGKVRIGAYAAVTMGVTIVDRLSIGENTVVGAGSVVLDDLPPNVVAYGTPARVIRGRVAGEGFLRSD